MRWSFGGVKAAQGCMVAIIACCLLLICMMLFPGGDSKHSARSSVCLSNLKNLGLACIMYSSDNDGFPAKGPWIDEIARYHSTSFVPVCPEIQFAPGTAVAGAGFAFDKFLAGAQPASLAEPEKEPLLYETWIVGKSVWGYLTDLPTPGRHGGRNHIVLADGHAKSIPALGAP